MTQNTRIEQLWHSGLAQLSGLSQDGRTLNALALRGSVVEMIEAAEAAALRPNDPGGLSHSLRAAIACRASRLNGHQKLAEHFSPGVSPEDAPLCDPENPGDDERIRLVLAFADKVTVSPREAQAEDIETLKQAGISDADIVRTCELTAFLAFHYRVIAGLSMMEQTA